MRSAVLITPGGVCTINQIEKRAAHAPIRHEGGSGHVTASTGAPNRRHGDRVFGCRLRRGRMHAHDKDTKREECEQRARECIDLAKQSTDIKAREDYIALAEQWAHLANEMARLANARRS
jgi:hypothetical protein